MKNEPPKPGFDGFVPTFNQMGYMASALDRCSQEFVDFSKKCSHPVLDIGAAFGIASLAALKAGATVYANDLDPRHLEVLKEQAPSDQISRLHLLPGRFPDELPVEDNFFDAILVSRVLHFFTGPQIEAALDWIKKKLRKGGRLFIVVDTPYISPFRDFAPIFEKRKKEGQAWPGLISDLQKRAHESRKKDLPEFMNVMDPDVLSAAVKAQGFDVLSCSFVPRPDYPRELQVDGRENVGLIAQRISPCLT